MVGQEPILFGGTIGQNISYGKDGATQQEIIDAAKVANAHDFIINLPNGYDTQCGEKYTQLSGGQKQRIAIARAVIRNPRILLLDEATSALDNESEKLVSQALEAITKGRTTLVIAHKLSTIQNADTIAFVKGGQIIERGSHEELLEQEGPYYQLIQRQKL
ncbi:ABC transporter B family protein [Cavenderia fasciculata]|uniref:ABC transporter B family protein n=1 Tax=Cavenderia fasciculata TaxID=261658 RepID=F4PLB7_CACFS|nr:ABC transporter B family protein [Cavenderia fasciculata]EGG23339.1 ABC transporter B family protein [Cavenderia fasciculata]|eukprot:XP_004361190.1 ABC transporter B family protein [Cavenderia fasciculata]